MWYSAIVVFMIGPIVQSEDVTHLDLPTDIKPTRYDLNIITYLDDKLKFEGIVNISVSIINKNEFIYKHLRRNIYLLDNLRKRHKCNYITFGEFGY